MDKLAENMRIMFGDAEDIESVDVLRASLDTLVFDETPVVTIV